MLRIALCLGSVIVLACGLRADEPKPKHPPFLPGAAKAEGDNFRVEETTVEYVPQMRAVIKIIGGKAVTENVTVTVPVYVTRVRLVPVKDVQVYLVGENRADPTKRLQRYDPTKIAGRFKDNTRVVIPTKGEKIDPADLKTVKDGTLILVLPRLKPGPRPKEEQ